MKGRKTETKKTYLVLIQQVVVAEGWSLKETVPSPVDKPSILVHQYPSYCVEAEIQGYYSLHVLKIWKYEPAHEIMALFILRKLILQTCTHSHPVGLDWLYFPTSCVRTAKALARLHGCAGSPEQSLVAYVIITIISWAGSIMTFITVHG